MRYRILAVLALSGCAHLTLDLKAHEEAHCREWNVPATRWEYVYAPASETAAMCRKATGLTFVEGCAYSSGPGGCTIRLPDSYRSEK